MLFRDQHCGGPVLQRVHQRVERREHLCLDPGAVEEIAGDVAVAVGRRHQQETKVTRGSGHLLRSVPISGSAEPSYTGTPVSTPRNLRSGSPTLIAPSFMLNSRIVRSCRPPRFLTTEMACRTAP